MFDRKAYNKAYYGRNREKYRTYAKVHRERNQERYRAYGRVNSKAHQQRAKSTALGCLRYLCNAAKYRAKKKGLLFNISVTDLLMPAVCPVLGIPLKYDNKGRQNDSPSLDRIDNTRGYEAGNVVVISWRANHLKSNATAEELEKTAAYVRAYEILN